MGYKIKHIWINNFKFIEYSENEPGTKIDFQEADLVLLNGPNGYGKTTTFEAIELVLTGDIKSFNSTLLNRGSISKSILANNSLKDIKIILELINEKEDILKIERYINYEDNARSTILINEKPSTQERLSSLLKFNKNIFDIGMYISQKDSLEFLEKKYGDRKNLISGILDSGNIEEKSNFIKKFAGKLKIKVEEYKQEYEKEIKKLSDEVQLLEQKEKNISNLPKEVSYKRLFKDEEYEFDLEKLNYNIEYDMQVEPLNKIIKAIRDEEKYKNTKRRLRLERVKNLDKNNFKAIYYANEIELIKPKIKILNRIKNIDNILKNREYKDVVLIGELANISNEERSEIQLCIKKYNELVVVLRNNENDRVTFINDRKKLINLFNKNIESNNFEKNVCPLCGNKSRELENLFNMTEKVLKENNTLLEKDLGDVKKEIDRYFDLIKSKNEKDKLINSKDYQIYLVLENLIDIESSKLMEEKEIMIEFDFINKDVYREEEFDTEYRLFKLKLEKEINKLGEKLSEQESVNYENLINKYYKDKIKHKEVDIIEKIAFIADKYSTGYSKQLSIVRKQLHDKNYEYEKIIKKNTLAENIIAEYKKKYDIAFKNYQTKLVENIKIPLYITTGKIIQNYPMGLGVNVDIKDNQVVFQTEGKDDDIFNYLSMGQLNGVALSIMLSVRNTINFKDGLDLILIDDPLQSIDDVSAISFADLLAGSFTNSQVIMSTHESDKSDLLEYKYRQYNKKVNILNMYENYINS